VQRRNLRDGLKWQILQLVAHCPRGVSLEEKVTMKCAKLGLFAGAAVVFGAGVVQGDILPPGGTQYRPGSGGPPNYTIGQPPQAGGAVGSQTSPINSIGAGSLVGTVESFVWDWDPSAAVQLAFGYKVTSTQASTRDIVRVTFDGPWTGVIVFEAGSNSGGTASHLFSGDPRTIYRSISGAQTPAAEFFSDTDHVGQALRPGQESGIIWFRTNAPSFTTSFAGLSDSGTVGVAPILAPVPTPGTLMLGMIGAAMAFRRRRR
jgi:hypothetical protein